MYGSGKWLPCSAEFWHIVSPPKKKEEKMFSLKTLSFNRTIKNKNIDAYKPLEGLNWLPFKVSNMV